MEKWSRGACSAMNIGEKFGRFTVKATAGSNKFYQKLWLCECECGNERVVCEYPLKSGKTKSSGCLQREITSTQTKARHWFDITGLTFGRLTVTTYHSRSAHGEHLWNCCCECGTKIVVRGFCLKNGGTQSCGCLLRERITKHGQVRLSLGWSIDKTLTEPVRGRRS